MSDMEAVNLFNSELSSLYDVKPPISKGKMTSITRAALKAVKLYKHVVQSVEKFIQKCKPEYKIPGLYVIDSIIRQSRHQFGSEKDVFAVRFSRNLTTTFVHLYKCLDDDKAKIIRVLNLWQKNKIFNPDVIAPLFDLANPSHPLWESVVQQEEKSGDQHRHQQQQLQNKSNIDQQEYGQGSHSSSFNSKQSSQEQHRSQFNFNQKSMEQLPAGLLDYDYDDDFDHNDSQQQQQQQGSQNQMNMSQNSIQNQQNQPPNQQQQQQQAENMNLSNFDALGSILTNPEVLRQLQTLQEQMAAAAAQSNQYNNNNNNNPEQERQRKLAELNKQEAAFDQRLAQTIGRLPFAVECDFESKNKGGMEMNKEIEENQRKVEEYSGQLLPPPFFQQMAETAPPPLPIPQQQQQHNQQQQQQVGHNYGQQQNFDRMNFMNMQHQNFQHQPPPQLQQQQQQQGPPMNMGPVPIPFMDSQYNFTQQPPPIYTIDDKDSRSNIISASTNANSSSNISNNNNIISRTRRSRTRSRSRSRQRSSGGGGSSRRKYRSSRSRSRERRREDKEREKERLRKGFPASKKEHLSICSTILWVGHLSKLVSQEEISDTFGAYGDIISIDVIPPRGCAFIVMNRRQDAVRALDRLRNVKLQGKAITLAWAPGKGVKGREWKDYWEVDNGVSYVPWTKLTPDTNIEEFEDGGCCDESTLPTFLQNRLKSSQSSQDSQNQNSNQSEKMDLTEDNNSASAAGNNNSSALLPTPLPTDSSNSSTITTNANVPTSQPTPHFPVVPTMDTDARSDLTAVSAASNLPSNLPVGPQNPPRPFGLNPQMLNVPHHMGMMGIPPPLLGPPGSMQQMNFPPMAMVMSQQQQAQLINNGMPVPNLANPGTGLLGVGPIGMPMQNGMPMGMGPLGVGPPGNLVGNMPQMQPNVPSPGMPPFRPQLQPQQQQGPSDDLAGGDGRRSLRADGQQKRKKSRFDSELEPPLDSASKDVSPPSSQGGPNQRPGLFERLQSLSTPGAAGPGLLGNPDRGNPGFSNGQSQPPHMHMDRESIGEDRPNNSSYIRPLMPNWGFDNNNQQNSNPFLNPQIPNPFLNSGNPFMNNACPSENPFEQQGPPFGNDRGFHGRGGRGGRGGWNGPDRNGPPRNEQWGGRGGNNNMRGGGGGRGGNRWGDREMNNEMNSGRNRREINRGDDFRDEFNRGRGEKRERSNERGGRDRSSGYRERDRGRRNDRNSRDRNSSSRDRSRSWSNSRGSRRRQNSSSNSNREDDDNSINYGSDPLPSNNPFEQNVNRVVGDEEEGRVVDDDWDNNSQQVHQQQQEQQQNEEGRPEREGDRQEEENNKDSSNTNMDDDSLPPTHSNNSNGKEEFNIEMESHQENNEEQDDGGLQSQHDNDEFKCENSYNNNNNNNNKDSNLDEEFSENNTSSRTPPRGEILQENQQYHEPEPEQFTNEEESFQRGEQEEHVDDFTGNNEDNRAPEMRRTEECHSGGASDDLKFNSDLRNEVDNDETSQNERTFSSNNDSSSNNNLEVRLDNPINNNNVDSESEVSTAADGVHLS